VSAHITSSGRPGKTTVLPFNATPATSSALGPQTYRIRLCATSGALVTIGGNANLYLAPNFPEIFDCSPGQSITVAQFSAAGSLFLTELE
jgi:hypothetical protein